MIGQLLTGRYLILKKLGSGGFSETYLARDKYLPNHPLCVVKCLKLSSVSTISLETAHCLFEMEAQILDQLGRKHSQIPTLFAYCHEQDQVYQIQEYIEGENLGDWIAQGQRIAPETAIDLLKQVLSILDFIHSHQVIHRDIKPSNLIRRHDGKIVLIDFGAACSPDTHTSNGFSESDPAFAIGTPGYMPDEQEAGTSGFSSDIYALGMSLLHLLTGVHPHEFQLNPIMGEYDWQAHLGQQSIAEPFAELLSRMVRVRARDRYQHTSDILTALHSLPSQKSRSRRHWLSPAPSRPRWQRLQPFALAMLLATGTVGWHFYGDEPASAVIARFNTLLQPASRTELSLVHDLDIKSPIQQMAISPDNRVLVTVGTDHALRLWSLSDGSVFQSLLGHIDIVTAFAFSGDGRLLVSGSLDRTVRLWDVESGTLLQTLTAPQTVTTVTLHPETETIVGGDQAGNIHLWDRQTGALQQTLHQSDTEITAVTYAQSPSRLISANSDHHIQIWDLQTGSVIRTFAGHTAPIHSLQVANDQKLYSVGEDRTLVWDMDQEELVHVFANASAHPVASAFGNHQFVTAHNNGSIHLWTRSSGQLQATVPGSNSAYLRAAISSSLNSEPRYFAGFSPDHHLRIWKISTGTH